MPTASDEFSIIKPDNVQIAEKICNDLNAGVAKLALDKPTTNSEDPEKPKKKGNTKKVPKDQITPEYIEMKRAEREEKKRLKREALIAQGIDPDAPERPKYIKRELLEVPHVSSLDDTKGAFNFKIMTYNLLAQALIRRTLFPDNGSILKWQIRSKVLLREIKDYDCDVLCVQEIDFVQYKTFWRPELEKLGYHTKFNRGTDKNHGISIFYKRHLFNVIDTCLVNFDTEKSGNIPPRTVTKNAGLIVALSIRSDPSKVINVGTAHLFWHPFGTYERTRQTFVVLAKSKEFERRVQILHPEVTKVWNFFAGDFNSQPYDSPYLSITSKPITYDNRCKKVISCSTSFKFSSRREGKNGEEEEGGNIEKHGKDQPTDPVPEDFVATTEQEALVKQIEALHNQLPLRAISLYSVAYKLVDPENSGIDNDRNEPFFSNWAYKWRGLLDYIFFIKEWDIDTDKRHIDDLESFEVENDIRINRLFKMPHPDEMDKGQPRENEYPSDHLCMIADITLL